jgi:hypothetical protein
MWHYMSRHPYIYIIHFLSSFPQLSFPDAEVWPTTFNSIFYLTYYSPSHDLYYSRYKYYAVVIPWCWVMTSIVLGQHLFAHGMIIGRDNRVNTGSNSSNTVLAAQTIKGCTNLNCKAKKHSTHTTTGQEVERKDNSCQILVREAEQILSLMHLPQINQNTLYFWHRLQIPLVNQEY